jgi:tetratricopeptide (TPR) repeat protein
VIVHEEVRQFGMVVDPGCMKCLDCVSVCPKNALYFGFGKPASATGARAAHRAKKGASLGEELVLGAAFLAAFFTFRGLYGVIPFLLALGLAGILACCFGALVQLARRPTHSFLGRALKRDGRLTRAGLVFVLSMSAVSLASAHSALVQFHAQRSARAFEDLRPQREAFLVDPSRVLADRERERAERGLASARFVERWGVLPSPQDELQLAWLQLFTGAPAGFEEHIRSAAAAQAASSSSLHYDLGRFLAVRNRTDEAAAAFEAALAAHPSAAVYDRLARLHFEAGRSAEALAVFERALASFPESPDLHFNRGVLLALLGRAEQALTSFQRTLQLDAGRVDARENLVGLLVRMGRHEEAREVARSAPPPQAAAIRLPDGH